MNTSLSRWNPFKEMDDLQKRFASNWRMEPFHAGEKQEALTTAEWSPRVDITEDDHEFVIKIELPEMKKEDVKVTVEDGALQISGERKFEQEEKHKKYHRIEREYGTFLRSFLLPAGTAGDKVTADFKDGVLKVHLPKETRAIASKTVAITAS